MKVSRSSSCEQKYVEMQGASGCKVRWLIGSDDGAPNFSMREFEVQPAGYTPRHHHPYEHEIFVLEGCGVVMEGNTEHPISAGDVVLVAPDEVHQFKNTGQTGLRFLCLIPNAAVELPVTVAPECNG